LPWCKTKRAHLTAAKGAVPGAISTLPQRPGQIIFIAALSKSSSAGLALIILLFEPSGSDPLKDALFTHFYQLLMRFAGVFFALFFT
jgi:hypothetical protein